MSVLFTADVYPWQSCHQIVMLLALTIGKLYSFFRVMSYLQNMQRENTQLKVSSHFFCPVARSLDGVTNAHKENKPGGFVLCLKRSKSIYGFLS